MKSSLGVCGVYSRFVADIAKISQPLTPLKSPKSPEKIPSLIEKETNILEKLNWRLFATSSSLSQGGTGTPSST